MNQPSQEVTARSTRSTRVTLPGSTVHDITIPPAAPSSRGDAGADAGARRFELWVQERNDSAVLHGLAAAALTMMLLSWTVSRGQVPALDPRVGVLLLVLHLGAWVTGWLSFEATLDLSRASQAGSLTDPLPPRVTFVAVLSACALLINTALVMAAILP